MTLKDFNNNPIQRGAYFDVYTGEPIRVYLLADGKYYPTDPSQTFDKNETPRELSKIRASQLMRISSREKLQKLLHDTQFVGDSRAPEFDTLPRSDVPFRTQTSPSGAEPRSDSEDSQGEAHPRYPGPPIQFNS